MEITYNETFHDLREFFGKSFTLSEDYYLSKLPESK